jgi:hypothetical protein
MGHSPTSADSCSASQDIHRLLRNPKVLRHAYMNPSPEPDKSNVRYYTVYLQYVF